MRIADLYGRHAGDVWVLGTGPSVRVFPLEILAGRVVIGLNAAWRHYPVTYSLTVHPELYAEYRKTPNAPGTQWVVKRKDPMPGLSYDDPDVYVFSTSPDLKLVGSATPDMLYIGCGVHCTAIDLAARMGASTVFMVGCDACVLAKDHHAHDQHVRYHGLGPDAVFEEYRRYGAKARRAAHAATGARVVTVSPFVGLGHPEEDYARLCAERGLAPLPKPKDTSTYKRKKR